MAGYTVVRTYPYPVEEVWQVLTDPEQVARWTTTGRGGRPEGFAAVPGTRFRFVGRPTFGWAGVVHCEVIAVDPPRSMHYTWRGDQHSDAVTDVTYLLEETPQGTRFTWDHTGFTGIGGFAMSRLLGDVRKKMLSEGVPAALEAYHRARP
ncbi:SRPBCC family protein [Microlunatus flavus]|uniref:Activator of Hsp90 ATPase homolog 1-like protein n=1 Tax=Microlunatus flavus TaxID=1036181 RepID=A0A1H9FSS7_9ACTN|nr:SRPBCC domain-containing protein [Microlunatus flavus]SEQ40548.1 Activator of Hsp90 ATPase homolog 1-like protein [Microlunatus flavus]